MKQCRSAVKKIPFLALVARRIKRLEVFRRYRRKRLANSYFAESRRQINSWIKMRTEQSNFYYNLKKQNREDLISLLSILLGVETETLWNYLYELEEDKFLRDHISNYLKDNPSTIDSEVAFGRREGWYVIARAIKPRLIVETGVHDGVGACLLASALIRNHQEGFEGRYIGTEINPSAGHLFKDIYCSVGEIIYDDSINTLDKIELPIDLFINDSDHSAIYEAREYLTIQDKLSNKSVILGDNSHVTDSLRIFSKSKRRPFVFFNERPEGHWYPGAGIGISLSSVPILRNQ